MVLALWMVRRWRVVGCGNITAGVGFIGTGVSDGRDNGDGVFFFHIYFIKGFYFSLTLMDSVGVDDTYGRSCCCRCVDCG